MPISTNDCSHLINRFLIYIQYHTIQYSRYSTQRTLVYDKKNIVLNHDVQLCHHAINLFTLRFGALGYFFHQVIFAALQNAKCKLQEYKGRGKE